MKFYDYRNVLSFLMIETGGLKLERDPQNREEFVVTVLGNGRVPLSDNERLQQIIERREQQRLDQLQKDRMEKIRATMA